MRKIFDFKTFKNEDDVDFDVHSLAASSLTSSSLWSVSFLSTISKSFPVDDRLLVDSSDPELSAWLGLSPFSSSSSSDSSLSES